jgi:membrane fusion protein, copper/silver efflux system
MIPSDTPTTTPASEPPSSPPPPKGAPIWAIITIVAVALVAFGAGILWGPAAKNKGKQLASKITSDTHAHTADATGAAQQGSKKLYTCGMHPWVILGQPGLCPICHMDLTPLDPSKITGEVAIDPVITQNIGVRIAPVVSAPFERSIRTVGTIAYNESALRDVNTKVEGWIEKLHITSVGQPVRAGDPLFDLYSPALYAAQEEYLLALRSAREVKSEHIPSAAEGAQRLLDAARTRLSYFDISDEQLTGLQRSGKPSKTLTIRSPYSGIVVAKEANEGSKVEPGMRIYRIGDLSTVWALASIYEHQLPFISEGQPATMTLSYIPGQSFQGRVGYIYPYLDAQTRQASMRLEFENPRGELKPGMYANVELATTPGDNRILAPRSAVIDTGTRKVAFVSLGDGKFDPRNVQTGSETRDGQIEILEGLKPGEMVVTSGQFLLDSEARMRESLLKMVKGDLAVDQTPVAAVTGESELKQLPEPAANALTQLLNATFTISDLLASDTIQGIAGPARAAASALDALIATHIPQDEHFWHNNGETRRLREAALTLASEQDIEKARLTFADFNAALIKLTQATGIPPMYPADVHRLHCPMYLDDQGASWLQPAGRARNPFYGSEMLECFDERVTMPRTGQAAAVEPQP